MYIWYIAAGICFGKPSFHVSEYPVMDHYAIRSVFMVPGTVGPLED